MKKDVKKIMAAGALALTITFGGLLKEVRAEDKPEADLTVGTYSKYVWRGYELSRDSLVVQPSMTVSYKGFGLNLWGNLDSDAYNPGGYETNNWTETDMTISYDGSYDKIGYGFGYIYYEVDGGDDLADIYGTLSLDTFLAPTLILYHEVSGTSVFYATLGISHSISVKENISLDLGAQVAYMDDDANNYKAMHDGLLSAALPIKVNEYFTVSPELYYSFALSSDASDPNEAVSMEAMSLTGMDDGFVYGGISLSMLF